MFYKISSSCSFFLLNITFKYLRWAVFSYTCIRMYMYKDVEVLCSPNHTLMLSAVAFLWADAIVAPGCEIILVKGNIKKIKKNNLKIIKNCKNKGK